MSVDEKTDVLFVPYFDSQLQYLSFEYTVTKPDGSTEIVNLNASTAVDSPEFRDSRREELQRFIDITEITEPIHVFKVYGGTSKGTEKHKISVKVKSTGTYSDTEKANYAFGILSNYKTSRSIFSGSCKKDAIDTICEDYTNDSLYSW